MNNRGMKRKHRKRRFVPWFVLGLLLAAALACTVLYWKPFGGKKFSDSDFGITTYVSAVDRDGDGVDDQTDLLRGAYDYIATSPRYKSEYYESGYPDDGYGVCTDVVAFALRSAGYDLRALVHEDVLMNPDAYEIETPDQNIDFRRVRNLTVWFRRNALSLTTDVSDIAAWQGGDIVVFREHIGIVSDHRNAHGVPYVLHHSGPRQIRYEEDILEKRDDIAWHFRIS